MPLKRIIPVLLTDGEGLVKTIRFSDPVYVGDAVNAIKIFNEKEVDELIIIDIKATHEGRKPNFKLIQEIAGEAFMPLTYGGGVKELEDFAKLYRLGVEKVVVNSLLFHKPELIREVVKRYGSQAVVASIDVKKNFLGKRTLFSHSGFKADLNPFDFANSFIRNFGVGEIFVQSVDRDGTWTGYDFDFVKDFVEKVSVPVIAAGGCSSVDDIRRILYESNADGAGIGSMAVFQKKGMGVLISAPDRNKIIVE